VQDALRLRLGKFGLTLEANKTKLVEFGRFAQRHADKRGRNRPETIYFLRLTLYCTRNQKGNFKVGMRTEKSRLKRSLLSLRELMRRIRHYKISDQAEEINLVLRGHYAYYGLAGNLRSLVKVYRAVERYWRRMLRSRSWASRRLTWDAFNQIKERTPLLKPKLRLPYRRAAGVFGKHIGGFSRVFLVASPHGRRLMLLVSATLRRRRHGVIPSL
jgi:RNA-directed DNA polymerase